MNTNSMSPILFDLSLGSGRIAYDDFPVELGASLTEQISLLKEDLIQIEYPKEVIVDIGWYPSFDIGGHFQIRVIMGGNWAQPILLLYADDLRTLQQHIITAITRANALSAGTNR